MTLLQKLLKLTFIVPIFLIASSAQGQVVLLGGWEGLNDGLAPKQSSSVSGSVTTTLFNNNLGNNDVTNSFSQINTPLWGTTDLDVDAATIGNGDDNRNGIWNAFAALTLTLTVTNNGAQDLVLDSIHFNVRRDAASAQNLATITYTAGNLSDSTGSNTTTALSGTGGNGTGYDIDLNSFLTDTTLANGESATFTWASSGGTSGGHRLDNFAISGSVIPEPSSFALLLAGLGLLTLRRRRPATA